MSCQCMSLLTVIERNHEIDATEIDGEKVMMDLERGQYFMLNGVGSIIWDLIERPTTVKELIEKLSVEYDVDQTKCELDVEEFLHNMYHENLVRVYE